MKKILLLIFVISLTHFSFAQQTFTTKKDALEFLKEAFSKNFIKTKVIINSSQKEISYDYKINEDHILIIKNELDKFDAWVTIPYVNMSEVFSLIKNDYYKKITGIAFKPKFGGSYGVSHGKEYKKNESGNAYTSIQAFPFSLEKGDLLLPSLITAINVIALENRTEAKSIKLKIDVDKTQADLKVFIQNAIDLKIDGIFFKKYSLYNSENILVNMHDFIEKNRRFKDKPTLLVTWSNTWCAPCLRKIDEVIKNSVTANYNLLIINKDRKASYSDIKSKMSTHKIDYFTNDILFLIDRDNQLEPLDKNSAPVFIWLDNNIGFKGIYQGYDITISSILSMLQELE